MFSLVVTPGYHLSDNSEGLFWRGKEGVRIYKCFCQTKTPKPRKWKIKRFLLIKRKQTSEASEFSAVHTWEDARPRDYWKASFDRATLPFFCALSPLGAHNLCSGGLFTSPQEPLSWLSGWGGGGGAVAEGFTSFVYWHERWHSLSTCSCFSSWNSYLV